MTRGTDLVLSGFCKSFPHSSLRKRTAGARSAAARSAQLIDVDNDEHLWAEKYTGTMEDVFAIQEKLSRTIVQALKVRFRAMRRSEAAAS